MSSLFLNEFIDLACITEFGRLFHGSATLRGNAFFLRFIFALWVNNLRESLGIHKYVYINPFALHAHRANICDVFGQKPIYNTCAYALR